MHKTFYASGFLYNPSSQQILLQQTNTITSPWVLFEKEYITDELPEKVFKENVLMLLDIKIDTIYPIYSYLTDENNRSLYYATTETLQEFLPKNNHTFRWFSFKEVLKIQATEQTKHDIIVGQRVIEAAGRRERGEHSF